MSNKNNSQKADQMWKFNIAFCISALFCIPIFVTVVLMFVDILFLGESPSFFGTLKNHFGEAVVLSMVGYVLAVVSVLKFWTVKKPRKTDILASQRWSTEEEKRKFFGITSIDTDHKLDVGGSPIEYLNENELLYEREATHDLTIGSTRSGKSRKIVRQLVMICSLADESMIFNDPKKEMYYDFHHYLEKRGYDIYVLDFRNPEYSDQWNPLDAIIECFRDRNNIKIDDADQWAQDMVTILVVDNGTGEKIWIDGQKALLKGLILAVTKANISEDKKNLYSAYQTMALLGDERSYDGDSKNKKMQLSAFMESLPESDIARTAFTAVMNAPEKTRGSFVTSALSTVNIFSSINLAKMLGKSDFKFQDFVAGKKALFVINPDEKKTYDRVASVCFDQSYQTLVYEANRMSGRKLTKRVHMIYDEFGNMPAIDKLASKLTVALSRGILYHLYIQDFGQLYEIYGEQVTKTIRGNCNLWYFISSADYNTCVDMANAVGEETIWTDSSSGNFNQDASTTGGGVNYSMTKRQLIDPNELMTADNRDGDGIIIKRTYFNPSKVYLPDCSNYKWHNEMKTDETETRRENRSLNYAVPRSIELNEQVLDALCNGGTRAKTAIINMIKNNARSQNKKPPMIKNLFWYWSMRDDLDESVINNVIDYALENRISTRKEIIDYLNGEKFFNYINTIDVDDYKIISNKTRFSSNPLLRKKQERIEKDDEKIFLNDYSKLSIQDKIEKLDENGLVELISLNKEIRG